jgi:hypothetical protein
MGSGQSEGFTHSLGIPAGMPVDKQEFDEILSFELHEPADILDPDKLYTIPEIARLLQGLPADAELSEANESVFIDWAIPWMIVNQDDLVIADPQDDDVVGLYGLAES